MNNYIKNKPLPKKEIKKNNKKIASYILLVLMVLWTLGSALGFVSFMQTNFKPNKASAYEFNQDIESVYFGSALPTATFSDWVHESDNKFYSTYERASTLNNVQGAFNGIKGTFTANVDIIGSWGAYSLLVPIKALYSANGSYNYIYNFYAHLDNYTAGASGKLRVELLSDLNTLVNGYLWESDFIWIDGNNDWISTRDLYTELDFTSLPLGFDNYFISFSFYFFGVDTSESGLGSQSVTFSDIGLYSSYDNNNPYALNTLPKWSANYGYIFNTAYNQGFNDSLSFDEQGVFRGITTRFTATYEGQTYNKVDVPFNTIYGGITYYNFDWETFGNSFEFNNNNIPDSYSYTQIFTFAQDINLNNVILHLEMGNWQNNAFLPIQVEGFVFVNGNSQSIVYSLNIPQILDSQGNGTGFYLLNQEVLRNNIENFNDTFLLRNIVKTGSYVNGLFFNNPISSLINYNSSYLSGYNNGFNDGQNLTTAEKENLYKSGYSQGYIDGNSLGFKEGVESANDYTFLGLFGAIIDAPLTALSGLLNFDILGFNMFNFFTSLFTLALIITVIRFMLTK